jgi:hypothetical protein
MKFVKKVKQTVLLKPRSGHNYICKIYVSAAPVLWDTMTQCDESRPEIWRDMSPPSSESRNKPSKKESGVKHRWLQCWTIP